MTKEEISIIASTGKAKYDAVVKRNLHFPKLLAPILKEVNPEYSLYSVEEIVDFIVKDSIDDAPVDDTSVIANQLDTEMPSMSEKLIKYDTRFKAINPKLSTDKISFYLHIDVEVQNDYRPSNPSYPIISRAVYYGAREISSQLGVLTHATNYSSVEKVYSIWICNQNVPTSLQNTVTHYKISKEDIIGCTSESESDYDLLDIVMIRRGKNPINEDIFKYLKAFFSSDIEGICKYVNIKDDEAIMKGVKEMSGLGESIYQEGALKQLVSLVTKGLLSLSVAAKEAQMSEEAFSELVSKNSTSPTENS